MGNRDITIPKYSLSEELISSISHGVGALLGIAALVLCIVKGAFNGSAMQVVSCSIYGSSLIILYTMSCLYHALKVNLAKKIFRIIDHCSIYLLIAGTYTPYTLVALGGALRWTI
jgi:hemolysin III